MKRDGSLKAFERLLSWRNGVKAVQALLEGGSDVMAGLEVREVELVPLEDVISHQCPVYYDMARMLAR
jgi:6-phosphofructokinase